MAPEGEHPLRSPEHPLRSPRDVMTSHEKRKTKDEGRKKLIGVISLVSFFCYVATHFSGNYARKKLTTDIIVS